MLSLCNVTKIHFSDWKQYWKQPFPKSILWIPFPYEILNPSRFHYIHMLVFGKVVFKVQKIQLYSVVNWVNLCLRPLHLFHLMGNGQINILMKTHTLLLPLLGQRYSDFKWFLFEQNCIVHFVKSGKFSYCLRVELLQMVWQMAHCDVLL